MIVVLIALMNAIASCSDAKNVIWAINCGSSKEVSSSQGFEYKSVHLNSIKCDFQKKDRWYSTSRSVDYETDEEYGSQSILYSYDQTVYRTERHYDAAFSYELELPFEGNYVLILKFCERLFNVKLGEKVIIKNLDIVKQVGPLAAYDEYIEFELQSNQIFHKKEGFCKNAYDQKAKKLKIELERGEKNLPLINGIVLIKGKLEDTDYSQQEQFRTDWKIAFEEYKKLELHEKKRNYENHKKLLKNVRSIEFQLKEKFKITGLIAIITSSSGILIIAMLFCIALFLMLFDFHKKIKRN